MKNKSPGTPPAAAAAPDQTDAQRHRAVRLRDRRADGTFVYSVRTTGVYCRPSCPSRPARPENISFHATPAEAAQAGFRPCRRCRPDQAAPSHAAVITQACRRLGEDGEPPRLGDLAKAAGLSASHFQRLFKAATGVTPKAYAIAQRAGRVRQRLRTSGTVTAAIYDAGFNSNGRFYAATDQILGMTPQRFRAGGAGLTIRYVLGRCSLGTLLAATTPVGWCAIALGDDRASLVADLRREFPAATLLEDPGARTGEFRQIIARVEQPGLGGELPLDIRGTAFQLRVWQRLRAIPPGETRSYAELARELGQPTATRAVAGACAANRLAVAIPCHRVVRSDGTLAGYRWGAGRKAALLRTEKAQGATVPGMTPPKISNP